jgi:hypothetical protein
MPNKQIVVTWYTDGIAADDARRTCNPVLSLTTAKDITATAQRIDREFGEAKIGATRHQ